MTSFAVFAEQPFYAAAGFSLAPSHLTCNFFNLGVGLPTLSRTVCGLLWLLFGQCECTLLGKKKKRRKKRNSFPAKKTEY